MPGGCGNWFALFMFLSKIRKKLILADGQLNDDILFSIIFINYINVTTSCIACLVACVSKIIDKL